MVGPIDLVFSVVIRTSLRLGCVESAISNFDLNEASEVIALEQPYRQNEKRKQHENRTASPNPSSLAISSPNTPVSFVFSGESQSENQAELLGSNSFCRSACRSFCRSFCQSDQCEGVFLPVRSFCVPFVFRLLSVCIPFAFLLMVFLQTDQCE